MRGEVLEDSLSAGIKALKKNLASAGAKTAKDQRDIPVTLSVGTRSDLWLSVQNHRLAVTPVRIACNCHMSGAVQLPAGIVTGVFLKSLKGFGRVELVADMDTLNVIGVGGAKFALNIQRAPEPSLEAEQPVWEAIISKTDAKALAELVGLADENDYTPAMRCAYVSCDGQMLKVQLANGYTLGEYRRTFTGRIPELPRVALLPVSLGQALRSVKTAKSAYDVNLKMFSNRLEVWQDKRLGESPIVQEVKCPFDPLDNYRQSPEIQVWMDVDDLITGVERAACVAQGAITLKFCPNDRMVIVSGENDNGIMETERDATYVSCDLSNRKPTITLNLNTMLVALRAVKQTTRTVLLRVGDGFFQDKVRFSGDGAHVMILAMNPPERSARAETPNPDAEMLSQWWWQKSEAARRRAQARSASKPPTIDLNVNIHATGLLPHGQALYKLDSLEKLQQYAEKTWATASHSERAWALKKIWERLPSAAKIRAQHTARVLISRATADKHRDRIAELHVQMGHMRLMCREMLEKLLQAKTDWHRLDALYGTAMAVARMVENDDELRPQGLQAVLAAHDNVKAAKKLLDIALSNARRWFGYLREMQNEIATLTEKVQSLEKVEVATA